jgi:predicted nuclease of restriction endonuclease-like (RecB) superfamily
MIRKKNDVAESSNYPILLEHVKEKIKTAQLKASLAVNSELVSLYWEIGHMLSAKMEQEGWGAKVIDRLAQDLGKDFPGVSGFSPRNLRYMRKFAQTYADSTILQAVLAKIPWWHNILLLEKLDNLEERIWYAQHIASKTNPCEFDEKLGEFQFQNLVKNERWLQDAEAREVLEQLERDSTKESFK